MGSVRLNLDEPQGSQRNLLVGLGPLLAGFAGPLAELAGLVRLRLLAGFARLLAELPRLALLARLLVLAG